MTAPFPARLALALLPLLTAAVHAQEAFTRQAANVRAGPDRSYPLVARLGPGAPLRVMGCLDDWTWCDVAFDDNRGWVYGPYLLYDVPGDRVPLYTYGPSLGIAIIGFSVGGYWDEHYRQRSWYGGRGDWERRGPPEHHAPEGLPPHAVFTPGMHPDRGDPRPTGRPPAPAGGRREPQAPSSPAQREPHPAPPRDNPRGNEQHVDAPPQREAPRQMQHAPTQQRAPAPPPAPAVRQAPPAQAAPARENSRGNPQHAEPPAQRETQRPMQQAPAQQHEPAQQRAPEQGHESGAQRGPDRGGGEKGGGGRQEREGH